MVAQIREIYARRGDRFEFHYLQMPRIFRNAFGTHWMLPPWISLRHGDETATLEGAQVARIVRALYTSPEGLDARSKHVWEWVQQDRASSVSWTQLMTALGSR